ncbi:alpha beta hydrolase fold family [Trichoderma arundinaceum]|uniref:Alpha beta hydrolase fold family n=1 Tax=Trichoderma arundinaceum TaxID=490622 RepID=A0A395NTD4_TRIAR|nr:alpha beta hydrolase fold family [Trichoderma arundinaceum]
MTAHHTDIINDPRFNKTIELSVDPAVGCPSSFKVTYADYGYRNEVHPEEENVFLFYGPLLGSRLAHAAKDGIAKKHKIRILNLDRPGIGGTDAVDVKQRMSLWSGCHSGGLIYALDMLLHHPEILHPERPYLAIGGPWILPCHTGSMGMSIIQSLPASVIGSVDKVARLINNHIGPFVGASLGFSSSFVTKLMPVPPQQGCAVLDEEARLEEELWPAVIKRIYSEGIQGTSSDAILLMQKGGGMAGWSDWGDYDTLIPRLADALRVSGRRLRVDVFYAENDFMIGGGHSKGAKWFDGCWDAQNCRDVIDYCSAAVKGADHDGIWRLRWGVPQKVLEKICQPADN